MSLQRGLSVGNSRIYIYCDVETEKVASFTGRFREPEQIVASFIRRFRETEEIVASFIRRFRETEEIVARFIRRFRETEEIVASFIRRFRETEEIVASFIRRFREPEEILASFIRRFRETDRCYGRQSRYKKLHKKASLGQLSPAAIFTKATFVIKWNGFTYRRGNPVKFVLPSLH